MKTNTLIRPSITDRGGNYSVRAMIASTENVEGSAEEVSEDVRVLDSDPGEDEESYQDQEEARQPRTPHDPGKPTKK